MEDIIAQEKGFIGGEFNLGIVPTIMPTLLPYVFENIFKKISKGSFEYIGNAYGKYHKKSQRWCLRCWHCSYSVES